MKNAPKKILVIGHSNIGDVCYDLAVVSALRREFPQASIAFMTSHRAKNLAEGYPAIDELIVYDRAYRDRGIGARLKAMGRLVKKRFDLAIALKKTAMHHFLGIPRRWSVGSLRDSRPHCVDAYIAFLRSKGLSTAEAHFDFSFSREDQQVVDHILKENNVGDAPLVAVLSTAAWSLKSWPVERWNALAEALRSRYGFRMVNVAKLGDEPLDRAVAERQHADIISAGQTTLKQALALIARCRLFIGPDSSFLHMASCLGVETIGLYGPTPAERFYPYFHRDNILRSRQPFACMPCYPEFKDFPCGDGRLIGACMEAIAVEDVLEVIDKKINARRKDSWQKH